MSLNPPSTLNDRGGPSAHPSRGADPRPTPEKERYEIRILQSLRRIMRAVDLHSRSLLMGHQITGPQLICLLAIQERGPITSAEIAREIHLSPSTMVGILDRLEEKSLVNRVRDRSDRRRTLIHLTDKGLEVLANAPSPLQSKLASALEALGDLEKATIALSLERIVELMGASDIDAAPILVSGPIQEPQAALPTDQVSQTP